MKWVAWVIVTAMVAVMTITWPTSASTLPTEHQAKVRTFRVLLALTEAEPDAIDETLANVTVEQCQWIVGGWRCRGSLSPVAISGLDGITCNYVVHVYRRSTRLGKEAC